MPGHRPAAGAAPTVLAILGVLVVPFAPLHLSLGVVGAVFGAAAVWIGRHRGVPPAVPRLGVLVVALAVPISLAMPFAVWLAVAAVVIASRWLPWLRPRGGWLARGTVTAAAWGVGAVVVIGTAGALAVWAMRTEEFGAGTEQIIDLITDAPFVVVLAFGVVFVVINAVTEEIAYRGVVQDAAASRWSMPVAVVVQAVAFGALHVAGFPAGWLGMAMAGVYGLLLGVLRERTAGLWAPVLVHMAADATIAILLWVLVVPAVT